MSEHSRHLRHSSSGYILINLYNINVFSISRYNNLSIRSADSRNGISNSHGSQRSSENFFLSKKTKFVRHADKIRNLSRKFHCPPCRKYLLLKFPRPEDIISAEVMLYQLKSSYGKSMNIPAPIPAPPGTQWPQILRLLPAPPLCGNGGSLITQRLNNQRGRSILPASLFSCNSPCCALILRSV